MDRQLVLKNKFVEAFKEQPQDFFSSPGRIEILGNHTDHNHGLVLVGAANLDIMAATKKENDKVILLSEGYEPLEVSLNDLAYCKDEEGTNIALIKGILFKMQELGYQIGGFKAYMNSIVPAGSGVSSSAAFECLIVEIENYYYNDEKIMPFSKATIAQFAEKNYFGKPCGLLDQCGVAFGGVNLIDFKNFKNPKITHLEIDLPDYHLVLVNTGGSHSDLTKHYAAIPDEMHEVARYFNKKYLAMVKEKDFYEHIFELRNVTSDRAILRAMHFFNENKRVKNGFKALKNKQIKKFFSAINESGQSSYQLLQNTCVAGQTHQNINLALALSHMEYPKGASRIHGGGFEGTILSIVHKDYLDEYVNNISKVYGKDNVHIINIRNKGAYHL